MLGLDYSKIFIVAVVALIVIGPKDLPRVLRTIGQVVGRMQRIRSALQAQFTELMKEADIDGVKKEFDAMGRAAEMDLNLARDPKTVMRGHLPEAAPQAPASSASAPDAPAYVSPEMQAYLAPLTPEPPAVAEGDALAKTSASTGEAAGETARPALAPTPI